MSAWFSGGVMEFVLLLLCCPNRNFFPWEIRVAFPEESQLRQSRATLPELMTSLVSAVFLCDHTIGCEAYSLRPMEMGYLTCAQMWVPCRTHKGGSGTNNSAQELTRRDRKTAADPAPPGDRTQGLWI